jgi:hypothetical protein
MIKELSVGDVCASLGRSTEQMYPASQLTLPLEIKIFNRMFQIRI